MDSYPPLPPSRFSVALYHLFKILIFNLIFFFFVLIFWFSVAFDLMNCWFDELIFGSELLIFNLISFVLILWTNDEPFVLIDCVDILIFFFNPLLFALHLEKIIDCVNQKIKMMNWLKLNDDEPFVLIDCVDILIL